MIQAKHCDLCDYHKRNLKNGLKCSLTDRKPDFNVSCSNIKFSNSFKAYLLELLNQIEHLEKRKTSVYSKFSLLSAIGLIIIFGSHSLLDQTFEMEFGYSGWIYFQRILLVYIVGAVFISMGFWRLNKYRNTLKNLESDKREIDMVLKNYNIDIKALLNHKK